MESQNQIERHRTLSEDFSPKNPLKPRHSSLETNSHSHSSLKTHTSQNFKNFTLKTPQKSNPSSLQTEIKKVNKDNNDLESIEEAKSLKAYYRSRYVTLIKSLQETNKQKLIQKEQEEEKIRKKKEKLKGELGLSNVKAKFNIIPQEEETKTENKDKKDKERPETEPIKTEDPKNRKVNASKILKRAQEHLQKIAEKKLEEQKKEEEEKIREKKLRQALKEAVLSKNQEDGENERKNEKLLSHSKKITITDMNLFKKRHKLKESDKVFIIVGCYPDIRKALQARGGWYENLDISSPCFDLKWTVRRKDVDFDNLKDYQLCNHFDKSTMITTKVGLCHSLRNLIWFNSVDIDTFYPRCFDLSESAEKEDFFTEFKALRAEAVLKLADNGQRISRRVVNVALKVCNKRLRDLDDLIDDPKIKTWELVTDKQWEILSGPLTGGKEDIINLKDQISTTLSRLSKKYPQFTINGINNIWILKPAGLSRGRGIELYNHLDELKDKLQKEGQWVIQKYLENPLLVKKKKFDIRQWVLVTSWNPLTAWFYDKCYLRFGVEDYSINDIKNRFIHLTNNSIQKYSENFDKSDIEGNMWHSDQFAEYLHNVEGHNIWEDTIKPNIKKIITHSLECVQDMVDGRKGSCELYGYDIMLDDQYNPWLIEVNCSPAMDYSTPITEFMVKDVMDDTIKIMVDYYYAPYNKKQLVDTGNFVLLVKSDRTVDRPIESFGLTLLCQGKAISK
ncbi:hypothetical protein SteCoe_7452 [Stentor coeruleus]|uniref:Tubulin--tyrosine ligase-like protein 9 n=1 Tax=Stentor coeruleus TaxID=5963 RepID=A0A1R2CML0_9CILI|nr:hypothetical protein SteCoe_7452 [Stentor coeruleus]